MLLMISKTWIDSSMVKYFVVVADEDEDLKNC